MSEPITFLVADVFDIPRRAGLLVSGRFSGGRLGPGDVLFESASGRPVRIRGIEIVCGRQEPDRLTIMVDRRARGVVRPGVVLEAERGQVADQPDVPTRPRDRGQPTPARPARGA